MKSQLNLIPATPAPSQLPLTTPARASRTAGNKPTRLCTRPNCTRKHYAKGFCRMHYARLQRGTLDSPARKPGRKCSYPTCNRKHYGRGLCIKHYRRANYDPALNAAYKAKRREDGRLANLASLDAPFCNDPGKTWLDYIPANNLDPLQHLTLKEFLQAGGKRQGFSFTLPQPLKV